MGLLSAILWPGFSLLTAALLIFCRMVTPVCTVHTIISGEVQDNSG